MKYIESDKPIEGEFISSDERDDYDKLVWSKDEINGIRSMCFLPPLADGRVFENKKPFSFFGLFQ